MKTVQEKQVKTIFRGKTDEAVNVKSFFFDPGEKFSFRAGQWAYFYFGFGGKEYIKHFTISSSPLSRELQITTIMSGSDYKNALDALEPGHEVLVKGPMGDFVLEGRDPGPVIFLAGGIGITPFKSMLEFTSSKGHDLKGALFYSNRRYERIAFRGLLDRSKEFLKDFSVIHTLTDTDAAGDWRGEKGYINAEMIRKYRPEYRDAVFYAAGPPGFNEAMQKMLREKMDIDRDKIKAEIFTGY